MIPRDNPIPALLQFIAAWVPDLSVEHRVDGSSIPAFVPLPLRSIYELAGNWPVPYTEQWRAPRWIPGLFGTQDQLLPPDQLKVHGDRFMFLHENQGVWSCETLINKADPPVYSDSLAYEVGDKAMHEVCPGLSHFLTTYCLQELAFGSTHLFCVDSEIRRPGEVVNATLAEIWVDGVYVYRAPTHSFYLCDQRLMVMATGDSYWIAYHDEGAAKLINTANAIRRIH